VLRIHTMDGQTSTLDLRDESQAKSLLQSLGRYEFQSTVSGLTLAEMHQVRGACRACGMKRHATIGCQFSLTRPQAFREVNFEAEAVEADGRISGGERLVAYCDDVRLSIMAHAAQPAVRIVLSKIGRRKFDPANRTR
jgi:hypothetical protein